MIGLDCFNYRIGRCHPGLQAPALTPLLLGAQRDATPGHRRSALLCPASINARGPLRGHHNGVAVPPVALRSGQAGRQHAASPARTTLHLAGAVSEPRGSARAVPHSRENAIGPVPASAGQGSQRQRGARWREQEGGPRPGLAQASPPGAQGNAPGAPRRGSSGASYFSSARRGATEAFDRHTQHRKKRHKRDSKRGETVKVVLGQGPTAGLPNVFRLKISLQIRNDWTHPIKPGISTPHSVCRVCRLHR